MLQNQGVIVMESSIFLTKEEVCARVRLSPASVDRLESRKKFPMRFSLTGLPNGKVVWLESEVLDWMHARSRRVLKPPPDFLDGDGHPPSGEMT